MLRRSCLTRHCEAGRRKVISMEIRIIRNAVRCNHCGDVIESTSLHDFRTCRCGRVSVDGGHYYLRRCADHPDDYTELSQTEQIPEEDFREH